MGTTSTLPPRMRSPISRDRAPFTATSSRFVPWRRAPALSPQQIQQHVAGREGPNLTLLRMNPEDTQEAHSPTAHVAASWGLPCPKRRFLHRQVSEAQK